MKVLILGGSGYMGSSAARDLIKHDEVSQVVLADNNIDMTSVYESVRNSNKVITLHCDITDYSALVDIIKQSDVVINTVGPYSRFGTRPVEAAIAAGVHYVDICDNCNVTRQIFELDESAKQAGVTICTGFGGGPGFTNILAKYGADKLDEVDQIKIFWTVGLGDPFGQAGLMQAMSQFSGSVIQYIDGEWVEVAAGSGAEEIMFLEPAGKLEVYHSAHPEAVTLPRYVSGVKTVIQKGGFLPGWVSKLFIELIELGFINRDMLNEGNDTANPIEFMASVVKQAPGFWEKVAPYTFSPVNVVVTGRQDGNQTTYKYRLIGHAGPANAINMSLCARMLYSGEIKVRGVVAPEGAIDPRKLVATLISRGAHFFEEKTVATEVQS